MSSNLSIENLKSNINYKKLCDDLIKINNKLLQSNINLQQQCKFYMNKNYNEEFYRRNQNENYKRKRSEDYYDCNKKAKYQDINFNNLLQKINNLNKNIINVVLSKLIHLNKQINIYENCTNTDYYTDNNLTIAYNNFVLQEYNIQFYTNKYNYFYNKINEYKKINIYDINYSKWKEVDFIIDYVMENIKKNIFIINKIVYELNNKKIFYRHTTINIKYIVINLIYIFKKYQSYL